MLNLKKPNRTIVQCGIASVLSVALTSWLHIRPLGILFLMLFTLWMYQTQCNVCITPPAELIEKYRRTINYLSEMRLNRPAMFCAIGSSGFAVLAVVGHLISGSTMVLVFLLLTIFITAKYNFKLTRMEQNDLSWSEQLDVDMELDDKFLPEINESNLFVLERASTLSSLSSLVADKGEDDKSDEIPSEFLLQDKLPDINENSDEDEDLIPVIKKKKTTDTTAVLDQPNVIEFKKGHFKVDSSISITSSSSEESLSKGLQFPDHTEVDCSKTMDTNNGSSGLLGLALRTQTQALLSNSDSVLPSLMSGIVQWSVSALTTDLVSSSPTVTVTSIKEIPNTTKTNNPAVGALDSSDDSDFEILENDDFK